jgi:hypothetical protein
VLVKVTLADASGPAAALAAIRTEMVLLARVVPLLARVWFDAKLVPPSCETSKPAGAATVTSAVKFEPVSANVCAVEAVPAVVVKGFSVGAAGSRVIVGVVAARNVPAMLPEFIRPVPPAATVAPLADVVEVFLYRT